VTWQLSYGKCPASENATWKSPNRHIAFLIVTGALLLGASACSSRSPAPKARGEPQEEAVSQQTLSHEELVGIAEHEALRLLEHTLGIDGNVNHVTEDRKENVWTFYVDFQNVTDTLAVIVVDGSGTIVSSSIDGGL